MALEVIGAGLGRTGTNSLKLALEELLGGRCYHMLELMQRPQDEPAWESAVEGRAVDWDGLMHEYVAAVDWPACAFWRELYAANPEAVVLLSSRDSAQAWWASMERTIIPVLSRAPPAGDPELGRHRVMVREMMRTRFTPDWHDRDGAMAAYERHLADVRLAVPAERLIDWRVGDGWGPICAGLNLPVPQTPFPHENRTADFRLSVGLD